MVVITSKLSDAARARLRYRSGLTSVAGRPLRFPYVRSEQLPKAFKSMDPKADQHQFAKELAEIAGEPFTYIVLDTTSGVSSLEGMAEPALPF
jgi:hypothetical protein